MHQLLFQIGQYGSLVFEGEETNYAFVASNIDQLEQIAETGENYSLDPALFDECMYSDQLRFLRGVPTLPYEYSGKIHEAYARGRNLGCPDYQDNYFARQLALISSLIKGNLGTKVYMVTLGGLIRTEINLWRMSD